MKYLSIPFAILSCAALVACGGGGGTTYPSIPSPTVSPTPLPSPGVTSAPAGSTAMSVTVPHRAANSQVTMPASPTKIVAIINQLNGSNTLPGGTQPRTQIDLSNTSAASCTSPGPCRFTMPAPAGALNVTVTVYAGANPIATDTFSYTSTGAAGQTQSDALKGVVGSVTLPNINVQFGQASTNELVVTAQDPSGATIADGAYANAVTLSLSAVASSSSGLQIIGSSTGPQSSVVLNAPSDRVQFSYDGGVVPGIQYTTANYTVAQSAKR